MVHEHKRSKNMLTDANPASLTPGSGTLSELQLFAVSTQSLDSNRVETISIGLLAIKDYRPSSSSMLVFSIISNCHA